MFVDMPVLYVFATMSLTVLLPLAKEGKTSHLYNRHTHLHSHGSLCLSACSWLVWLVGFGLPASSSSFSWLDDFVCYACKTGKCCVLTCKDNS